MGIPVKPGIAFSICHGYKIGNELILWSPGVIGALNDEQEKLCKKIIIENAKGGPRVVSSVEEALKVETEKTPKMRQVVAVKTCAHLLDLAEDKKLVHGIQDVWAFMDYCMAKMGFGEVEREVPEQLKVFIDTYLGHEDMLKSIEKLNRIKD